MNFLISDAFADVIPASQAAVKQSSIFNILLLVLFILFLYLIIWRPQSKRIKAHQAMINSLQVDDEVITNGGLFGKVTRMDNSIIDISIAENTIVKLQKSAIANILPKGTIK